MMQASYDQKLELYFIRLSGAYLSLVLGGRCVFAGGSCWALWASRNPSRTLSCLYCTLHYVGLSLNGYFTGLFIMDRILVRECLDISPFWEQLFRPTPTGA